MEAMKFASINTFFFLVYTGLLLSNLVHCRVDGRVHDRSLIEQRSKDTDFIDELPNQPEGGSHFRQYGGTFDVDAVNGVKTLFYYFVEAAGANATSKPLILWLNEDLTCSSLGPGAFQQIGPFRVDSDGQTLLRNPYSWNNAANLLFVDPIPTVGYSKANLTGRLNISDAIIVSDLNKFMDGWFKRFPEFRIADFYIAGQDYIGYIAPSLALRFVHRNRKAKRTVVNIKGVILGNAYLDDVEDNNGKMEYYWTHSIISDTSYDGYIRDCVLSESQSMDCFTYVSSALDLTYKLSKKSIYDRECKVDPSEVNENNFELKVYRCGDEYVAGYMNMPFVQRALNQDLSRGVLFWNYCNKDLITAWDPIVFSNMPDIKRVLDTGNRVLLFSADLDLNHPLTGTQKSLAKLNLTVGTPWKPWFGNPLEVAGYVETYKEGLTYTTVRNSGMWVGVDQPLNSLVMLQSFLQNKPFPSSKIFKLSV